MDAQKFPIENGPRFASMKQAKQLLSEPERFHKYFPDSDFSLGLSMDEYEKGEGWINGFCQEGNAQSTP